MAAITSENSIPLPYLRDSYFFPSPIFFFFCCRTKSLLRRNHSLLVPSDRVRRCSGSSSSNTYLGESVWSNAHKSLRAAAFMCWRGNIIPWAEGSMPPTRRGGACKYPGGLWQFPSVGETTEIFPSRQIFRLFFPIDSFPILSPAFSSIRNFMISIFR